MKGFIFTIDALAALSIVIAGAYAFYAFQSSTAPQFAPDYRLLGRDYLTLVNDYNSTPVNFTNLTGLSITTNPASIPSTAKTVAHALFYRHARACAGSGVIGNGAPCLSQNDANITQYRFEDWVWQQ